MTHGDTCPTCNEGDLEEYSDGHYICLVCSECGDFILVHDE
jgi:hypothetical protein